ncbi:MAG: hypothetical protein P9L99_07100 [Candidatus Lernaella stagnicola]|nr:hypothetical protein [Candidatus Lernaella stagnicola]
MRFRIFFVAMLFALLLTTFLAVGCASDDDDDDDNNDDATSADDDDDDDNDDDVAPSGRIPTTLDMNYVPLRQDDQWVMAVGPGDARITRNDLDVPRPTPYGSGRERLSLAYFMTMSDLHVADEEAPTRLDFFDSREVLFGAFTDAARPQYDLSQQVLMTMTRTANQIQRDYERDFDFALFLGDSSDSSQLNELEMVVDVLDGGGIRTESGWCRPDSGDLNLDPGSGRNLGERNFGVQETGPTGNSINRYEREGLPNSNADFPCAGLLRSSGDPLPWFACVGNHDVINMGLLDPLTPLTFYKPNNYEETLSPFGYISGLASMVEYWKENPDQEIRIAYGILGLDIDWRVVFEVFDFLGLLGDYETDIVDDFDPMVLLHDTPADPSDDGVDITADLNRAYMDTAGVMHLLNESGHGFVDRNEDGVVTPDDGAFYRLDVGELQGSNIPLRILAIDSAEQLLFPEGGLTGPQLGWLQREIKDAEINDALVIVASHHHEAAIVAGGSELEEILHSSPNVIAHLVGHGHYNEIVPHPTADKNPYLGYWEIQVPSDIDFPQQARIVEIVDNRDGSGSIFLTNFDHFSLDGDDADTLADFSRELAFSEALADGYDGVGPFARCGTRSDRNVELIFPIPTAVVQELAAIEADGSITSVDSLGHGAELPFVDYPVTNEGLDDNGFAPRVGVSNFTSLWTHMVNWAERNDPAGLGQELDELRPLSPEERARLRTLGYLQ